MACISELDSAFVEHTVELHSNKWKEPEDRKSQVLDNVISLNLSWLAKEVDKMTHSELVATLRDHALRLGKMGSRSVKARLATQED